MPRLVLPHDFTERANIEKPMLRRARAAVSSTPLGMSAEILDLPTENIWHCVICGMSGW